MGRWEDTRFLGSYTCRTTATTRRSEEEARWVAKIKMEAVPAWVI